MQQRKLGASSWGGIGNFLMDMDREAYSPGLRPPQVLALPYSWEGSWPHRVERQATLYCDRGDSVYSVVGAANNPGVEGLWDVDWGKEEN